MTLVSSIAPKVSIGMPVRNGGKQVEYALRSIFNQTEQNFEIIISDNDSNDGSSEFLKEIAATDDRVRYTRQTPAICAYDNFRFVLHEARGEFFMWAAHDDTRDADFVSRLVATLEKNEEAILAFGDLNIITPENSFGYIKPFPFQTIGMGRIMRLLKTSRLQCYHIYGLWRTHAIRKVPYAYCAWWPDLPMLLSATILGTFVHVKGTRFHYMELPKSNYDRIKDQDYLERFSLLFGVTELVTATYRACANTGGVMYGVYVAFLIVLKQAINLPGFIYRRFKRLLFAA